MAIIRLRFAFIPLLLLAGPAYAQQSEPDISRPPRIQPGLHAMPPDRNFENRELHAEWRPLVVILHGAVQDFYRLYTPLVARLNAVPRRYVRHGKIDYRDDRQCPLIADRLRLYRALALFDDTTNQLMGVAMHFAGRLPEYDARYLGSSVGDRLRTRTHLQILFANVDDRIDITRYDQCLNAGLLTSVYGARAQ